MVVSAEPSTTADLLVLFSVVQKCVFSFLAAATHKTFSLPIQTGPDEAECQAALAESTDRARQLEAALAAAAAEAEELSAAISAEREEAEALRAQLGHLEGQTVAVGEQVEANARFLATAQWADEVAATITLLGGLSLLHVTPGALHLKLVTAYPTGVVRSADPGPCATADHELSVHLAPGSSVGAWVVGCGGGLAGSLEQAAVLQAQRCGSFYSHPDWVRPEPPLCCHLTVMGAQLTPPDVEVGDIVEAARDGGRAADFVVREVQARLGAWLHRWVAGAGRVRREGRRHSGPAGCAQEAVMTCNAGRFVLGMQTAAAAHPNFLHSSWPPHLPLQASAGGGGAGTV